MTAEQLNEEGNQWMEKGEYGRAEESYGKGLAAARQAGDQGLVGTITMNLASVHVRRSEYARALEGYAEALAIHRDVESRVGEGQVLGNLGMVHAILGDYPGALEYLLQAIEIDEQEGFQFDLAADYAMIANLYFDLAQYRTAIDFQKRSLEIRTRLGDHLGQASVLINLGNTYGALREVDAAIESHEQALALLLTLDNPSLTVQCLGNLGNDYLLRNHEAAAMEMFLRGLRMAKEVKERGTIEYSSLQGMGRIYLASTALPIHDPHTLEVRNDIGSATIAVEYFQRALEIALEVQEKTLVYQAHEDLATAYRTLDDTAKALHHLELSHVIEREVFNSESDHRLKSLHVIYETEKAMKEREVFRLNAERLEQENAHKTRELQALALHLAQKNNMLSDLRSRAKEIAKTYAENVEKLANGMVEEINAAIRADDAWERFNEQFEQLHHDFMANLSRRFPALTQMELKICALSKINLTTKEIASILTVSVRTIEDHRNNIRKKLGMDSKVNFAAFLAGL